MDYNSALNYILSFTDYEKTPAQSYSAANFDLRRMHLLLERLGNPHLRARTIHIAGTKGKGSTAAMIASALRQACYHVGLYTSPHLHTMRERIQVNGEMISEHDLIRLVEKLQPEVEAVNRTSGFGTLTTFEVLTALAFACFAELKVDFMALEVGLGGRLDATNVVKPEVCVITAISLDHVDILGHTVAEIALQKAGIIKPGAVVISSPQAPEAETVIRAVCNEKRVKLIVAGKDITWQRLSAGFTGQTFKLQGAAGAYDLTIPLLGSHQMENAAVAVAALEAVGVDGGSIARGLAKVNWPGRLEVLGQRPWVIVDGAHNLDSAQRLAAALKEYFNYKRLALIVGMSYDKNIAGVADALAAVSDSVIATRSRHPRAADPKIIASEFERHGKAVSIAESVPAAYEHARTLAKADDLICATGSLFVVAEMEELLRNLHCDPYPR
ncbi:MAG: folylpolyglutamate synthase/dihydrofolate synthase family protein [Dehalococcoidia bacterium]|nr:folylpolyglutamate synthase/dihydrofolate synthase family protein [Dehalococcoidia bacterium]